MRVIARKTLREYWERHPEVRPTLQAWYADVSHAAWESPSEIKRIYANASILPSNRVVFNIKGNQYRLVVAIQYDYAIVFIRFIGTHAEYDKIDATTV